MSFNSYENAAKDIEQEKKMVAALKRLSIGNMMNYDPDLPPSDEFEFQYQYDDSSLSNEIQKEASLSRGKSLKRQPTKKSSMSEEVNLNSSDPETPPLPSISISRTKSSSGRSSRTGSPAHQAQNDYFSGPTTPTKGVDISFEEEGEDIDEAEEVEASGPADRHEEALQSSLESNPLLWVPANLHPEVDPEQFKMHLKNTVEDLLEKKLSRNTSKRSSLSLTSSTGDIPLVLDEHSSGPKGETNTTPPPSDTSEPTPSYQEKRYSNPSLRDLTNELEQLSKMAGMDSNDAVTLARTLSKSSLGYTDVERQAFDEMTSPPKKNEQQQHQLLQSYEGRDEENSPTPKRDQKKMYQPTDYSQKLYQKQQYKNHQRQLKYEQAQAQAYQQHQQQQQQHSRHHNSSSHQPKQHPEDFSLKRSRRLDYRKPIANVAASGSNLQQTKADKLSELRSNLNTSLTPEIPLQHIPSHKRSQNSKTKSYSQSVNRSSQMLFSYRNPNTPPSAASSPQISRDSPYSSGQGPVQGQMKYGSHSGSRRVSPLSGQQRSSSGEHAYLQQQQQQQGATTYSGAAAIPYIKEKVRQRQVSPNGHYSHQLNSLPQLGQQNVQRHSKSSQMLPGKNASAYVQNGPQNQMIPNQGYIQTNSGQARPLSHRLSHFEGQQQQQPFAQKQQYQPSQGQGMGQGHQHLPQGSGSQRKYQQGFSLIANPTGTASKVNNKSRELNQNLDLLRSEINEFKESLSKSDTSSTHLVPKAAKIAPEQSQMSTPETMSQEPDFSFDTTYQDISYEDSLGIEKEVLKELNIENNQSNDDMHDQSKTPTMSRKASNASAKESEIQPRPIFVPAEPTSVPTIDVGEDDFLNSDRLVDPIQEEDTQQVPEPEADLVADAEVKPISERIEINEEQDNTKGEQGAHQQQGITGNDESELKSISKSPNTSPRKKKTFGILSTGISELPLNSAQGSVNSKSLKKKKSWSLFKERSVSTSAIEATNAESEENQASTATYSTSKTSNRSISNPETSDNRKISEETNLRNSSESATGGHVSNKDAVGKENMITKLFKIKRSNSATTNVNPVTYSIIEEEENPIRGVGVVVDYDSDSESLSGKKESKKKTGGLFKKKSKKDKQVPLSNSNNSISSFISSKSKEEEEEKTSSKSSGKKLMDKIRNKSEERIDEEPSSTQAKKEDEVEEGNNAVSTTESTTAAAGTGSEEKQLQTTLEVQEKLKKSIKRSSRANQPLEFTDSAFGFPLPPPSQSTLVMLDYRFPVHVERAIYRLSHLKLANPKRSLREQVLLSNFMYAYLNLVDHTLHLEQQLSNSEAGSLAGDDAGGVGEEESGELHVSKEYNNINDNDEMTDTEHALFVKDEPMIEDDDFETEETLTIDLNVANYDHKSQIEV